MNALQFRNCIITTFVVPPPIDRERWINDTMTGVRHAVWQVEECPSTGAIHIQAYVEFSQSTRVSTVRRILNDATVHVERRRASRIAAYLYCIKDESRIDGPWFYPNDQWLNDTPQKPGARTDISSYTDAIFAGFTDDELAVTFPTQFERYPRVRDVIRSKMSMDESRNMVWPFEFHPWQERLLNNLKMDPDDRTIYWYWSSVGGVGKSQFAKFLRNKLEAFVAEPSKKADIVHAYMNWKNSNRNCNIVVFDLSKSEMEHVTHVYALLERFKNGYLLSSKYNSMGIVLPPFHVVVFANQEPDYGKIMEDRWCVTRICKNLTDCNEDVIPHKRTRVHDDYLSSSMAAYAANPCRKCNGVFCCLCAEY